jgi:dolichol kinase
MKFQLLPSINGVERMTVGCVLFPIIIYVCFVLFQYTEQVMLYYLPILILAICDPIAALVGIRWPLGKFKTFGTTKTLSGSIGFFIASILITTPMLASTTTTEWPILLLVSLVLSAITAFVEAISHKGYDNVTIPGSVVAVLLITNQYIV